MEKKGPVSIGLHGVTCWGGYLGRSFTYTSGCSISPERPADCEVGRGADMLICLCGGADKKKMGFLQRRGLLCLLGFVGFSNGAVI